MRNNGLMNNESSFFPTNAHVGFFVIKIRKPTFLSTFFSPMLKFESQGRSNLFIRANSYSHKKRSQIYC